MPGIPSFTVGLARAVGRPALRPGAGLGCTVALVRGVLEFRIPELCAVGCSRSASAVARRADGDGTAGVSDLAGGSDVTADGGGGGSLGAVGRVSPCAGAIGRVVLDASGADAPRAGTVSVPVAGLR